MSTQKQAAWLQAKQDTKTVINKVLYPLAGPDKPVIRTKAVAINRVDHVLLRTVIMINIYPAVLGRDAAGAVGQVGANPATRFIIGDLIGTTSPVQDCKYAAFQEFVVLKTRSVATIPESLGLKDVVVIPLGTNTFTSGLSDFGMLNLVISPDVAAKKKTLLVWGASGSVGSSALQLVLAAGNEVLAIVGSSNHEILRSIGATERFDYHGRNMVTG